jgi:hypothetical protein
VSVRRLTNEDFTLVDATGDRYPPRVVALGLLDTGARFALLVVLLVLIGLTWEALA